MNNYQAPSNQKAKVEKPGASFNSSPDHMSESSEAETQTVERRKPTRVGYVFRDILLRRLENRRSHKREEKV